MSVIVLLHCSVGEFADFRSSYPRLIFQFVQFHFDRIFFGLMFFMVVLLSAYFISNIYAKYSAKPMIISLNSVSTNIKTLPFPGKENNIIYFYTKRIKLIFFFAIALHSAVTVSIRHRNFINCNLKKCEI